MRMSCSHLREEQVLVVAAIDRKINIWANQVDALVKNSQR